MVRWLKKLFGGKQERQEKQDSQRSFNQAPPPPEGGARTSTQPPAASDNTWATSTRPRPAPPKNPLESLAADEQQQAAVAKAERVSAILRDEPLSAPNDSRPPRLPMAMEQELPGAALNQAPASPILNDSVGRQSSTAWSSGGTAFSRPNSGRTTNTWTPSEAGSRPTSGATVASRPKSGRSRGGVVQPTSDFSLHQKQGAAAKEEPASFGSLMRRRPHSGGRTIDPLSSPKDSDISTPPPSSGGAFACINSDEKGPGRNKMQMNDPFFSPPGGV